MASGPRRWRPRPRRCRRRKAAAAMPRWHRRLPLRPAARIVRGAGGGGDDAGGRLCTMYLRGLRRGRDAGRLSGLDGGEGLRLAAAEATDGTRRGSWFSFPQGVCLFGGSGFPLIRYGVGLGSTRRRAGRFPRCRLGIHVDCSCMRDSTLSFFAMETIGIRSSPTAGRNQQGDAPRPPSPAPPPRDVVPREPAPSGSLMAWPADEPIGTALENLNLQL